MPGAFSSPPTPPPDTHPTARTGVNKAWILRSTRAFSAGVKGAAVLVRVPAAACSPGLPSLALRPGLHLLCPAWCAQLARSPRVSARPRRPVPQSNPAGPPLSSGCPAPCCDWRAPPRVNGVTPLPHSPPTHSSAPGCWPEVRQWGSARVRGWGGVMRR